MSESGFKRAGSLEVGERIVLLNVEGVITDITPGPPARGGTRPVYFRVTIDAGKGHTRSARLYQDLLVETR